jgi:hypothetical protein
LQLEFSCRGCFAGCDLGVFLFSRHPSNLRFRSVFRIHPGCIYKPNMTRKKFVDSYRVAVANLAGPVSQALPSGNTPLTQETMNNDNLDFE